MLLSTLIRRSILVVGVGLAAWWIFRPAPPETWLGRPAPDAPRQRTAALPLPWKREAYTFSALAWFDAKGVVLSRKNYSGGHDGELCPTDFAVGWGVMSESAAINEIDVSQRGRFLEWEIPARSWLSISAVVESTANMHLIPANDDVRRELALVRRHELIDFSGFLVEVKHPDRWTWRSSTTRYDTGGGACEVVWVTRVAHRKIDVQ